MLSLSVILAIGLLLIGIYYTFEKNKKTYNLPPGPKRLPILGNLLEFCYKTLIKKQAPFLAFADWSFKYGPISYAEILGQRVVVISDAQIAQKLCTGQAEKFSDRPIGPLLIRILNGKGIVFNNGPCWKEHRSFLINEFRKFGFGKNSIEPRIQHVIDEYLLQVAKTNGTAHDPHMNLATAVYNVLWAVISGDRFEWDDPFLRKIITNLEENLHAVELIGVHNYITFLMPLHLLWHNPKRLVSIVGKRFTYFRRLISKKIERIDASSEVEESIMVDYLNLVRESEKSKKPSHFSDAQLMWFVSDLFIAGGETSMSTLRWIVLCLATFPEIQERIRKEILDKVGQDSSPTYSHRTLLPYTEAFIHEVLRCCGVTPIVWRDTLEDATYQGYDIPKNTWILLHFWGISLNESHWKNCYEFQPERFLNEDGSFRKNDNFLVFSTGRRQCPGEGFARMELFLFTTAIVQKFKISYPEGQKPLDIRSGRLGVTYGPPHFKVCFTPVKN